MALIDNAIKFYESSPDGQYDDYVQATLRALRNWNNATGDEQRETYAAELRVFCEIEGWSEGPY